MTRTERLLKLMHHLRGARSPVPAHILAAAHGISLTPDAVHPVSRTLLHQQWLARNCADLSEFDW